VPAIDPRLVAALAEQLRRRDLALSNGAHHVGWKLGMGQRERIAGHIAVGYLTSATLLGVANPYSVPSDQPLDLHVDGELCVELDEDLYDEADWDAVTGAVGRCWPALEFVDLAPRPGEPDAVVVDNVFHRGVTFGDTPLPLVLRGEVTAYVNGEVRELGQWPSDIPSRLTEAARILASVGQRLRAGDRIITGSIVQVSVQIGDRVEVDFGRHATLGAEVTGA
jgi:2-keto-4-pentenoate hydratase